MQVINNVWNLKVADSFAEALQVVHGIAIPPCDDTLPSPLLQTKIIYIIYNHFCTGKLFERNVK